MEFTIKEAIKEKEDLIKNSRGARSFAPFVKKAKEQIEQWKKTGTYPEFVSERKTREKEEKQRIRDIDKTTADEVGARVSKAAKKYKPKPKPEKVKAKKDKKITIGKGIKKPNIETLPKGTLSKESFLIDIEPPKLISKKKGGKVQYRSIGGKVSGNDIIKMIYD